MMRKGISPLIAAVLLIAFTMAVAAILTAWVTTFTEDVTEDVGEEGEQVVDCSTASLEIIDTSWETDSVTASVANTGNTELLNVTMTALSSGGVLDNAELGENGRLAPGDIDSATISGLTDNEPERIQVGSQNCPDASDQATN